MVGVIKTLKNPFTGKLIFPATKSKGVYDDKYGRMDNILDNNSYLGEVPIGVRNNGIFRGKNLGTITSDNIDSFLETHKVSTGEFYDIYLGDYFVIQDGTYNKEWVVAGFDTEYDKGDTALTLHHISLIPKTILFNAAMNDTDTTEGGYAGSKMHTTVLPAVAANFQNVLGSHLLKRRVMISNAVSESGVVSSATWYDAYCVLLSEIQVFGFLGFSKSVLDVGEGMSKLPIFNFEGYSRNHFWLRGVSSTTEFARASAYKVAFYATASSSYGVKPLITIG